MTRTTSDSTGRSSGLGLVIRFASWSNESKCSLQMPLSNCGNETIHMYHTHHHHKTVCHQARPNLSSRSPPPLPHWLHGQAIEAWHEAGFLHLDIKPGNVALDAGGGVVVLDAGHARKVTRGAVPVSHGHGTPGFVAPELLADDTPAVATAACDVFSLGKMLQYLVRAFQVVCLASCTLDGKPFSGGGVCGTCGWFHCRSWTGAFAASTSTPCSNLLSA